MPSSSMLLTLIDEIGPSGTTCTTLTGFGFSNCQNNYYWSSIQSGSLTTNAFYVHFNTSNSLSYDKTGTFHVACLRRD